jgi:hypothetical protein
MVGTRPSWLIGVRPPPDPLGGCDDGQMVCADEDVSTAFLAMPTVEGRRALTGSCSARPVVLLSFIYPIERFRHLSVKTTLVGSIEDPTNYAECVYNRAL